jgi:glycosyltransferase involved in cell wall biosynthesis
MTVNRRWIVAAGLLVALLAAGNLFLGGALIGRAVFAPKRPADEGAIRAALLTLARDPDQRARLGQTGRSLVQNRFRWDNEAQTLVELYAGLIGAPKSNVEF